MIILTEFTVAQWITGIICGIITGFSKCGMPGIGILAIPLMAMVFPPARSTGLLLPILIAGDVVALITYHRHASISYILKILPSAFIGIIIGFVFIKYFGNNNSLMKILIGCIVIITLLTDFLISYIEKENRTLKLKFPVCFLGIAGGFATITANAAGPIFIIYLLKLNLDKETLLGTQGWLFLILNTGKIPFQWIAGNISFHSLIYNLILIPSVILGAFAGKKFVSVISKRYFVIIAKTLAFIASLQFILAEIK